MSNMTLAQRAARREIDRVRNGGTPRVVFADLVVECSECFGVGVHFDHCAKGE